jgi:aryl-alcohol dehydrogenase-like predicted oxidoreductase
MNRVIVPGTKLCVSRLAFGTASLHHLPTTRMRQALLAAAADLGFSHFDTSPYYGFGIAEIELGRSLCRGRNETTIASKVGLYPPAAASSNPVTVWARKAVGKVIPSLSRAVVDWSVKAAEKSLTQTLRTLRRDQADLLFLHEPAPGLLSASEFLEWLGRQRQAGKVRFWGLAGPLHRFRTWIGHPLAEVIQVPDGDDVLMLANAGREPQFTYGALSAAVPALSGAAAIRAALTKNQHGAIVVSSRNTAHLRELVAAVESLCRS